MKQPKRRLYRVLLDNQIHSAFTEDGVVWICKNFRGEIKHCLIEEMENAEIFDAEKYKEFELWKRRG